MSVQAKTYPETLLVQPHLSGFIIETLRAYRVWALAVFLLRCASLSEKIIWPLFVKLITDTLVIAHDTGFMDWHRVLALMTLGFVSWYLPEVSDAAASVISGSRIPKMRAGIRLFVLEDLYRQSQQFFHDRFAGSIGTSLRDLSETVSDVLNEAVYQFAPSIITFAGLCVLFFRLDTGYVLLMLAWMVVQISLVFLTRHKAQSRSRAYADVRSELVGKIIDSVTNHLSVASFTAHTVEHAHIGVAEETVVTARSDAVRYQELVKLATGTLEVAFVFF